MHDIRLPRHVIDRLEYRWATRLQPDAKAWNSERDRSVRPRPAVRAAFPSLSDVPGAPRLHSEPIKPQGFERPSAGTLSQVNFRIEGR
jgi:hypothetical protein